MKKVLVVEDSPIVFDILRSTISPSGKYSVDFFCENGVNLLEMYRKERPDLVLMDIVMDGNDGIDLTRMLMKSHPEARVVILSACCYQDLIDQALDAGAVSYVQKPWYPDQLISVFDKVLENRLNTAVVET